MLRLSQFLSPYWLKTLLVITNGGGVRTSPAGERTLLSQGTALVPGWCPCFPWPKESTSPTFSWLGSEFLPSCPEILPTSRPFCYPPERAYLCLWPSCCLVRSSSLDAIKKPLDLLLFDYLPEHLPWFGPHSASACAISGTNWYTMK